MKSHPQPITIHCYGYTPDEFVELQKGLFSIRETGIIVSDMSAGEGALPEGQADVILLGSFRGSHNIIHYAKKLQETYPDAIYIRCTKDSVKPEKDRSELFEFEGTLIWDPESPVWEENLALLILHAVHHKTRRRERKERSSSLTGREHFLQEILSSATEGIIIYDADLVYLVWNRFMETLTGLSEDEVLGETALSFVPEQMNHEVMPLMLQALQGIPSTSGDIRYEIPATGKNGWVSIIFTPYRSSEGDIIGVIAFVRDISKRKRAEDDIKAQKGLLRSIIDTVPVSIVCFDEKGTILLANRSYCRSFGLVPEVVEGLPYQDLYEKTRFEGHGDLMQIALSGREVPFNEEIEAPDIGKGKRYLRGRYSPLRDPGGVVTGVVSVIIDITDLKLTQESLGGVNAKLNLLSQITRHDILNSLTAMLGYLTYAEEEKNPDQLAVYIHKALQVSQVIQEQIEFTRDYQDLGVKEPVWQSARDIFHAAVSGLKFGDIEVIIDLEGLYIYADPLLERVMYNLVDNAIRYGGNITRISAYWFQKGGKAVLIISDDGAGIDHAMKGRIFLKGVGKNTGLGLFLAREILDITGLSIAETGTPGEGATFEILIPEYAWEKR